MLQAILIVGGAIIAGAGTTAGALSLIFRDKEEYIEEEAEEPSPKPRKRRKKPAEKQEEVKAEEPVPASIPVKVQLPVPEPSEKRKAAERLKKTFRPTG